jgi:uncharacterized protein DUF7007
MATTTPWGISDYSEQIAPGIMRYGTPRHGGIHLSAKRQAEMPTTLLGSDNAYFARLLQVGWYEEDCEWARVALAFPQFFTLDDVDLASELLRRYNPEVYQVWKASH